MNQIIKGKRYNTESAREVGTTSRGVGQAHETETLLRKRTGEFFLHAVGGPESRYARRTAHGRYEPGERLIPLTDDEARTWIVTYMGEEICAYEFSAPESEQPIRLSVIVSPEELDKLKTYARSCRRTVSDVLRMLIDRL